MPEGTCVREQRAAQRITGWVHVSGLRPPTAAGRERDSLGKAADTPAPGFAVLRGVVNREYVRCNYVCFPRSRRHRISKAVRVKARCRWVVNR